ncbi:MAG: hypothetical protein NT027_14645 [Proteobacteria bacterium]|nr:hypothetical protein [Pseudomonadota bacterium]
MKQPTPKILKVLGYILFGFVSLILVKYLWTTSRDINPTLTWSNKPFSLQTKISVTGSVIELVGITTAPENSVFQVFANRELIATESRVIKISMLPPVGDCIYETPINFNRDKERGSEDPQNFYGLVKNGAIRVKLAMYHPFIQAAGQTLDSAEYRFDKFDLVTFKIKILKSKQHPPEQVEDSTSENWVDFKNVKSIPIRIYPIRPSDAELELIQRHHDNWCPGLDPVLDEDGQCRPIKRKE